MNPVVRVCAAIALGPRAGCACSEVGVVDSREEAQVVWGWAAEQRRRFGRGDGEREVESAAGRSPDLEGVSEAWTVFLVIYHSARCGRTGVPRKPSRCPLRTDPSLVS